MIYYLLLKRLPPLPPTSGTRGMDAWMLGYFDACHCACLVPDLGRISHFVSFLPSLVSAARPWCHLGSTGVARMPT